MSEVILTDQSFEQEISKGVCLVDFWAPWCGPCQAQGPIIEELAKEIDFAKVCKLNVDENQASASKYSVMSIPTIIIFKDGSPVETMIGLHQKEDLKSLLEKISK